VRLHARVINARLWVPTGTWEQGGEAKLENRPLFTTPVCMVVKTRGPLFTTPVCMVVETTCNLSLNLSLYGKHVKNAL
jgi:hypothetical protein